MTTPEANRETIIATLHLSDVDRAHLWTIAEQDAAEKAAMAAVLEPASQLAQRFPRLHIPQFKEVTDALTCLVLNDEPVWEAPFEGFKDFSGSKVESDHPLLARVSSYALSKVNVRNPAICQVEFDAEEGNDGLKDEVALIATVDILLPVQPVVFFARRPEETMLDNAYGAAEVDFRRTLDAD